MCRWAGIPALRRPDLVRGATESACRRSRVRAAARSPAGILRRRFRQGYYQQSDVTEAGFGADLPATFWKLIGGCDEAFVVCHRGGFPDRFTSPESLPAWLKRAGIDAAVESLTRSGSAKGLILCGEARVCGATALRERPTRSSSTYRPAVQSVRRPAASSRTSTHRRSTSASSRAGVLTGPRVSDYDVFRFRGSSAFDELIRVRVMTGESVKAGKSNNELPVIGVAGFGRAGADLASRWHAAGYEIDGYDPELVRALEWSGGGKRLCCTPDELSRASIVVITSDSESALFGARGLLVERISRQLIVDLDHRDPARTREFAARAVCAGASFVDAYWPGRDEVALGGIAFDVTEVGKLFTTAGLRARHIGGVGEAHAFGLASTALENGRQALAAEVAELAVAAGLAADTIRCLVGVLDPSEEVDSAGLGEVRCFADALGLPVPILSTVIELRRWEARRQRATNERSDAPRLNQQTVGDILPAASEPAQSVDDSLRPGGRRNRLAFRARRRSGRGNEERSEGECAPEARSADHYDN